MKNSNTEAIVVIHGLWMKGFELFFLKNQFKKQGYRVYIFRYSSLFKKPEVNATALFHFVSSLNEKTTHFVAHSLGGIVLSHLFANYTIETSNKVALIASPVNGSAAAAYVAKNKFLKWLLGKSIINGLLGDIPKWTEKHKTCVIAGIKGFGMGSLLARPALTEENDGTVNLNETQIATATESHIVSGSHFSLLFSNKVAKIIISFLKK